MLDHKIPAFHFHLLPLDLQITSTRVTSGPTPDSFQPTT